MNINYLILILFSAVICINGLEFGISDLLNQYETKYQISAEIDRAFESIEKCKSINENLEKLEKIKEIKEKLKNIFTKHHSNDSQLYSELTRLKNTINDNLKEVGNILEQCLNGNEEREQLKIVLKILSVIINVGFGDGGKRLYKIYRENKLACVFEETNFHDMEICASNFNFTGEVMKKVNYEEIICGNIVDLETCTSKTYNKCNSQDLNYLMKELFEETKSTLRCTGCAVKISFYLIIFLFVINFFKINN